MRLATTEYRINAFLPVYKKIPFCTVYTVYTYIHGYSSTKTWCCSSPTSTVRYHVSKAYQNVARILEQHIHEEPAKVADLLSGQKTLALIRKTIYSTTADATESQIPKKGSTVQQTNHRAMK